MAWSHLIIKGVLSGTLVVAASELAKSKTLLGALVISLPLASILTLIWLHQEGAAQEKIIQTSNGIVWLVIPSLVLFLTLPMLLARDWEFWPAIAVATGLTVIAYLVGLWLATRFMTIT